MYPLNFNGNVYIVFFFVSVSVLTFWFADLIFFGGCGQWHWVGIGHHRSKELDDDKLLLGL